MHYLSTVCKDQWKCTVYKLALIKRASIKAWGVCSGYTDACLWHLFTGLSAVDESRFPQFLTIPDLITWAAKGIETLRDVTRGDELSSFADN